MKSLIFVFIIAILLVRVTPISSFLEENDGSAVDFFLGDDPNLSNDYADTAQWQSFLSNTNDDLLQLTPGDIDMWSPDSDLDPSLESLNLDTSFTLSPSSSSSSDTFDLASSEPFAEPELNPGHFDDYIADPHAKCPLETYRSAACCGRLLSEDRFIPDCTPGKTFFFSSRFSSPRDFSGE